MSFEEQNENMSIFSEREHLFAKGLWPVEAGQKCKFEAVRFLFMSKDDEGDAKRSCRL